MVGATRLRSLRFVTFPLVKPEASLADSLSIWDPSVGLGIPSPSVRLLAYAIGNPKPVPEEDIKEYQSRWEKGTRRRDRESSGTGEPSDWRYNKKLLQKG